MNVIGDFDPLNKFGVGANGEGDVAILMPPVPGQRLSKADALNLACWLLVLAGVERHELLIALVRIEGT